MSPLGQQLSTQHPVQDMAKVRQFGPRPVGTLFSPKSNLVSQAEESESSYLPVSA